MSLSGWRRVFSASTCSRTLRPPSRNSKYNRARDILQQTCGIETQCPTLEEVEEAAVATVRCRNSRDSRRTICHSRQVHWKQRHGRYTSLGEVWRGVIPPCSKCVTRRRVFFPRLGDLVAKVFDLTRLTYLQGHVDIAVLNDKDSCSSRLDVRYRAV